MDPSPEHLHGLFQYTKWADGLMVGAARTVPDSGYYADRGFSLASIHKLLVHAMAAQKIWLRRWEGMTPRQIEDDQSHPTRELLEQRWPAVHAELFAFLDRQTTESLAAPVEGVNAFGQPFLLPLSGLMLHVVDHATYHRGQSNSMIEFAGDRPANPFYHRYLKLRAEGAA